MKKVILKVAVVVIIYLLVAFLNKGSNYVLTGTIPLALFLTIINDK